MNVDFPRHCGGEHLPGASLSSARPLWTSEGRLRGPQRTQASWDTRQIATGPGQRGDIRDWLPVIKAAPLALMLFSGCNLDPWDRARREEQDTIYMHCYISCTARGYFRRSQKNKDVRWLIRWISSSSEERNLKAERGTEWSGHQSGIKS